MDYDFINVSMCDDAENTSRICKYTEELEREYEELSSDFDE